MGGGGKSSPSMPSAAAVEAPKSYQQEQEMTESSRAARDLQNQKILAYLGQEGSIKTSPFGSQEAATEYYRNQGKTLLGG